ncbi:MAG: tRNA guanosine(15) transglycosylase TgtA [Conexivisphaerales archaeon]
MLSFEVRETDLAGRIGRIHVGGKTFETPAYLPVVHPIAQQIPAKVLKEIGFEAIMTNSYITMKKFPDGVDIHRQTGFDGVIMTDSGGYQALLYGDVEAEPIQIAEYQVKIGTDIAVILDLPTGAAKDRKKAELTVHETLLAAEKSLPYMKKPPAWAGPIQGGSFEDLVRLSAKKMSSLPFDLFAIGSPVEFMNNYRYREVVKLIATAKSELPADKPVHLFGAGHPFTIPLAVALGCDMFDSASYALFAKEDKYMLQNGVRELHELEVLPCSCRVCSDYTAESLKALPREKRMAELALHNLFIIKQEVDMTKEAIREGRLWNYLMLRLRSHPNLFSVLPFPEPVLKQFEEGSRVDKRRAFFFFDVYDLDSPEVRMHRRRMISNYTKRSDSLTIIFLQGDADRVFTSSGQLLTEASKTKTDLAIFHPFLSVIPVAILGIYPLVQNVTPSVTPEDVLVDSLSFLMSWIIRKRYSKVNIARQTMFLPYSARLKEFVRKLKDRGIDVKLIRIKGIGTNSSKNASV